MASSEDDDDVAHRKGIYLKNSSSGAIVSSKGKVSRVKLNRGESRDAPDDAGQHAVTVISVNAGTGQDKNEGKDANSFLRPPVVSRSTSNQSSSSAGGNKEDVNTSVVVGHHTKKLGHRRVRNDVVTYKKIETTQLMGSIQLGIQQSIGTLANMPDRDMLMQDFFVIDSVTFTKDGSLYKTPAHHYSEFRFRSYAPFALKKFRRTFEIDETEYLVSLCSEPMIELSNPGASGSIFYITQDDMFICKTVQKKEAEFLQKLLPGYNLNLNQNPRTLLPKFFGFYCYSCNAKNVRIVVMNNLLPSDLKMHHKFDLKGSTLKRKASRSERAKSCPTFKDLDFMEMYPDGISLQPELYDNLITSIQRDCLVLESYKIMDYSLLIGIHNLDQANRELQSGDFETADAGPPPSACSLERQGSLSLQHRERIAYTSPLESITMELEHEDQDDPYDGTGPEPDTLSTDVLAARNVWGGIPAKNHKGENLLLFIGIIDILQSYRLLKKAEHYWKSLINDGDTVSVHRPSFYAKRFLGFMRETVFRKMASPLRPALSFRRTGQRRTISKEATSNHEQQQDGSENEAPARGTAKDPTSVTVITIGGSSPDASPINLPPILQDRKKSSDSSPPQSRRATLPANMVTLSAKKPDVVDVICSLATPSPGAPDDTGSVITMTSDERVQIYVPSPQTTPYSTITSKSGGALKQQMMDYRSITPVIAADEAKTNQESPLEMVHLDKTSDEEKGQPVSLSDISLEEHA